MIKKHQLKKKNKQTLTNLLNLVWFLKPATYKILNMNLIKKLNSQ